MENISGHIGIIGSVESRIGGRQENQDDYGFSDTPLGLLIVVCDGMGGGPAGRTASSLARKTILSYVSSAPADAEPDWILKQAVVAANDALISAINDNPEYKGMGTTCVCLLINGENATIAHVGDSRCYQLRLGKMIFRTSDHSYVAELVKRGTLSEEEARNSKYSNVITRAIGVQPSIDPEVDTVVTKPGDRFALMSDGIWGTMPEEHLVKLLGVSETPNIVVAELADRVDAMGHNLGGGHDNLTLAVVDIPYKPHKNVILPQNQPRHEIKYKESAKTKTSDNNSEYIVIPEKNEDDSNKVIKKSKVKIGILSGIITLLLIIIAVLAFILFSKDNDEEKAPAPKSETIADFRTAPQNSKKSNNEHPKNKENNTDDILENNDNQKTSVKGAQSIENSSTTVAYLNKADSLLRYLSNYGKPIENTEKTNYEYDDNTERNKRIKERRDIQSDIAKTLKKCADCEKNKPRRDSILKLYNEILNNTKLNQGIDTNHGFTTAETEDLISKYIAEINALKNQKK